METKRTTTATATDTAARTLTCDLAALTAPDLAVVDALARLRLAAARHGVGLLLLNASGRLRELLAFSGLADVLPVASGPAAPGHTMPAPLFGLQPGREAEQREEHVRIEEVGERGDPTP
ncbi:STAS domain-containing protein [Kitasatospora sp. NPDC093558]|uniref:STAS domain-containing protein n=1 Tax=Kitasatospora sp. NPDC093558 TaxID=3155201 RepID=UPI00342BD616